MTRYNFDEIIDRSHTDCIKYDRPARMTGRTDLIPLWVADMDFRTPDFVLQAIREKVGQGILGYPSTPIRYYEAIRRWAERQYALQLNARDIHYIPGVVPGICFAINALTACGDGVLIQEPVYHPFRYTIEGSDRRCLVNELRLVDGRLVIDFEDFEAKLQEAKLFILCYPHNPLGQVWSLEELARIASLCHKYGVTVISDEIHADMLNTGVRHIPFAMVSDVARSISITFMAPSKVFNMPGVVNSYCFILDEALRRRFFYYLDANDLAFGNAFAYDCAIACYSDLGEDWRQQMLAYVGENMDYVIDFLQRYCPRIVAIRPQASFLLWLDCSALDLPTQEALVAFFVDKAGLYLNDGTIFGKGGEGYMRLNVASPRSVIVRAMQQLHAAYKQENFGLNS